MAYILTVTANGAARTVEAEYTGPNPGEFGNPPATETLEFASSALFGAWLVTKLNFSPTIYGP